MVNAPPWRCGRCSDAACARCAARSCEIGPGAPRRRSVPSPGWLRARSASSSSRLVHAGSRPHPSSISAIQRQAARTSPAVRRCRRSAAPGPRSTPACPTLRRRWPPAEGRSAWRAVSVSTWSMTTTVRAAPSSACACARRFGGRDRSRRRRACRPRRAAESRAPLRDSHRRASPRPGCCTRARRARARASLPRATSARATLAAACSSGSLPALVPATTIGRVAATSASAMRPARARSPSLTSNRGRRGIEGLRDGEAEPRQLVGGGTKGRASRCRRSACRPSSATNSGPRSCWIARARPHRSSAECSSSSASLIGACRTI